MRAGEHYTYKSNFLLGRVKNQPRNSYRLSNDAGRILSNAVRGHLLGLTERFDYFVTGESLAYERKVAGVKFGASVMAAVVAYFL
jgi:hypothetical protein